MQFKLEVWTEPEAGEAVGRTAGSKLEVWTGASAVEWNAAESNGKDFVLGELTPRSANHSTLLPSVKDPRPGLWVDLSGGKPGALGGEVPGNSHR
ncbi:hypothetical protein [Sulfodiicoccus acidiphilus]|uniref:hypothetical protein n=1 Tax=Sulfodiicoccus acidiphilus TaxID=1670455 RepID=UPI000F83104A|nr:hypothetical protein [Sulfodiicoccus acidiphilus]